VVVGDFFHQQCDHPKKGPEPSNTHSATNLLNQDLDCQCSLPIHLCLCYQMPSFNTVRHAFLKSTLILQQMLYLSTPSASFFGWILMDAASRAAAVEVADIALWVCCHCSTGTFFICLMSNEIKLFHSETSCVQTAMSLDRHLKKKRGNIHAQIFLHKSPATTTYQKQNALLCCVVTFGFPRPCKVQVPPTGRPGSWGNPGDSRLFCCFCWVPGFWYEKSLMSRCSGGCWRAETQSVRDKTQLEQWQ